VTTARWVAIQSFNSSGANGSIDSKSFAAAIARPATPVSLRPGSVASFAMDLGSPLSNLGVYCRSVDSVSVRLPGYRLADRVRDRISVCGSGGTVSAFVKGSDGPQRQLGERDPPPVALVQADCEHPTANLVYRPRMIVAGCGGAVFSLTRIRYGRWGGRVVAGHAIQRFNDCKPDCATGSTNRDTPPYPSTAMVNQAATHCDQHSTHERAVTAPRSDPFEERTCQGFNRSGQCVIAALTRASFHRKSVS
jgi:hypothetical protein